MIFMGHRSYIVSDSNISFSVSFRICGLLTIVFVSVQLDAWTVVLGLIKIDGRTCGDNIFHFTPWTSARVTNGFECDRPLAVPNRNPFVLVDCMHSFAIYFRSVFSISVLCFLWNVRKVLRYVRVLCTAHEQIVVAKPPDGIDTLIVEYGVFSPLK